MTMEECRLCAFDYQSAESLHSFIVITTIVEFCSFRGVIVATGLSNIFIGADFNFEFGSHYKCKGRDIFKQFINQLKIMPCDYLMS